MMVTVPIAEAIVGRLSQPKKMPCPAWGISASACKRGGDLADNLETTCAKCYAMRGRYLTPAVRTAHERRLAGLAHPQWVEAMATLVDAFAPGYFRWFDAGDLQSPHHLGKIVEVAARTPRIRHWLPTHEPFMVEEYFSRSISPPHNLVIRISADFVEDGPTTPTFGFPTSTVHKHKREPVPVSDRRADSIECPAYHHPGGTCRNCRACWSPKVRNVSYLLNGGHRHESKTKTKLVSLGRRRP